MNKLISPAHSRKLGRPGKGSRSAEFPVSFTPAHATPFVPRSRAPPANVVDFFRRKKARTRANRRPWRTFLHESRSTRVKPCAFLSLQFFLLFSFFFSSPTLRVTDGFCRKFGNPGDSSPLPGSSTYFHHFSILFLSLSLYFFFWFWSTFPGSKKKITQLPSTRHMVLCRFFFFSSFFLDVHHPTSPYFPPLDSDPFVRWALPSVRQRSFFSLSLFLCSSTYGNLYQFQKGWWMDGGEKKSSLKICLTVEGSSQWECDVDVPMVFRREKRWVEW